MGALTKGRKGKPWCSVIKLHRAKATLIVCGTPRECFQRQNRCNCVCYTLLITFVSRSANRAERGAFSQTTHDPTPYVPHCWSFQHDECCHSQLEISCIDFLRTQICTTRCSTGRQRATALWSWNWGPQKWEHVVTLNVKKCAVKKSEEHQKHPDWFPNVDNRNKVHNHATRTVDKIYGSRPPSVDMKSVSAFSESRAPCANLFVSPSPQDGCESNGTLELTCEPSNCFPLAKSTEQCPLDFASRMKISGTLLKDRFSHSLETEKDVEQPNQHNVATYVCGIKSVDSMDNSQCPASPILMFSCQICTKQSKQTTSGKAKRWDQAVFRHSGGLETQAVG